MKPVLRIVCLLLFSALINSVSAQCISLNYTSTNVSCYQGTTGSITATASGGAVPYQYQLAEAGAGAWSSSNVFNGLAAGVYPLSAKDGAGCVKTVYVTITQPSAIALTYTTTDPVCSGSNNGTITTTTTGGVSPYTYSWKKNGSAFSTSANLTSLAPANYELVVTDAAGCAATPSVPQNVKAITLSGFNADVVANGTQASATSSTSAPLDQATGYVLYASGYSNTNNSAGTNGLPANGSFNSAQDNNRPYQLAPYSSNNVLLLRSSSDASSGGVTSGSLTFGSTFQSNYSSLYVVGTTGSGTGTINYQVNYSDASTSTGTLNFPDWYLASSSSSTNRALGSLNRVSRDATSGYQTGGNFNLFEAPITISDANQAKTISSVTFTWFGSGSARTSIFAITGYTSTTTGIRINEGPSSSVVPSIAIASDAANNQICSGQAVTFTATPTNGGTTPSFQWKVNGSNVGTNSSTFSSSSLANNSQVSAVLTPAGNVGCLSTTTATSNIVSITIATNAASVAVAASSTNICAGTNVTFTAAPTNGGTAPSYQWRLNGINVGGNSSTYSTGSLINNDKVNVVMTSNIGCVTGNPATSNIATMTVNPVVTPTATVISTKVNPGLLLSSTVTNVGSSPAYQWYKDGVPVLNATSSTLSAPTAAIGEIYSVKVTSSNVCSAPAAIMSNYVTVNAGILPLKLEWFRAVQDDNTIKLSWQTASEQNLEAFEIQRSSSGDSFATIGTVQPKNSTEGASYTYPDKQIQCGTYTYRLTHRDHDQNKFVDGTATIRVSGITPMRIATKNASWQVLTTGITKFWLVDIYGVKVQKGEADGNFEILKPALKGVYYLQLHKENGTFTYTLID
jgi:hypothetical protein